MFLVLNSCAIYIYTLYNSYCIYIYFMHTYIHIYCIYIYKCAHNVYPNLSFGIVRDWHWVQHVSVAGTFRSIHQKRPTISIKTQRKQRQSVSPCLLSVFMSFHALSGIFQDLWYVDVSSNGLELFRYHWQSHLLSPGRVSGGAGAAKGPTSC